MSKSYPEVYHRPTDNCCPQCNCEEESADHFLKCSSRKTGGDFALALREKLSSLAKEGSEFGLNSGVTNALAELSFIENAHKGIPHSWYTKIDRVHKSLRRAGLKPPPRNTWITAVLRTGFQALYDTRWRIRNEAALNEEKQHSNPARNRRLMRLPKNIRRATISERGAVRGDGIPLPPPKQTTQQIQETFAGMTTSLVGLPMVAR